jgi:hypothetical protein
MKSRYGFSVKKNIPAFKCSVRIAYFVEIILKLGGGARMSIRREKSNIFTATI